MEYRPLIINACLTGMVPMKKDTPHVPISPREIIKDAQAVIREGATVLHIHARNPDGQPTYKKEVFAEIITGIRKQNKKVVICVTTSGRLYNTFEARSEVLNLSGKTKPDFASLTLGSMNFPKQASINSPEMIQKLAMKMKEQGIHPEWEVFEPGMLHYGQYLVGNGILDAPRWLNIFWGSLGTMPLTPSMMGATLSLLPHGWQWAGAGTGRYQLPVNTMAIAVGGHIRVGLEDNIYMDAQKTTLATNPMLVRRVVQIAKTLGRTIANIKYTRASLGLD